MKAGKEALREAEMCYTPLIDIVFLLLIFFMSTQQYILFEQRLDLTLPVDGPWNPSAKVASQITVFVQDDRVARISPIQHVRAMRHATYYPLSRDARPIADLSELRRMLARLHDADANTRILIALYDETIDHDQFVPFFNMVALMDTCRAVGLENVVFQAPQAMNE